MDTFDLPPPVLSPSLAAVYHRAIEDRKASATTTNPFSPVREFESYLVYEFGWYRELTAGDFLSLSDRYALLAAGFRRGRDSAVATGEFLAIQRILGLAPWIRTRSGNAVLKTDIYVYTDAVAQRVLDACERAASKSRPVCNIDLSSVTYNALAAFGFHLGAGLPDPLEDASKKKPAHAG